MILNPIWNKRLQFQIEKEDNFQYKDRRSKEFKREYHVEIEKLDNNIFEAYYPESLLNQMKPLNIFKSFIYNNSQNITKTLFYKVNKSSAFEQLLNKNEIIESLKNDCTLLKSYLSDVDEKEDLKIKLELIIESENEFQKHILDDVINIHYNYRLNFEPDYYFEFHKESITKQILKKLFPKSRFILGEVNWMRHTVVKDFMQIEYLKGIENITSGYKPKWKQIEDEFVNGDFKIKNHPNLTLKHEIYLYHPETMILESYEKQHVLDSPLMRKETKHKIKKANI